MSALVHLHATPSDCIHTHIMQSNKRKFCPSDLVATVCLTSTDDATSGLIGQSDGGGLPLIPVSSLEDRDGTSCQRECMENPRVRKLARVSNSLVAATKASADVVQTQKGDHDHTDGYVLPVMRRGHSAPISYDTLPRTHCADDVGHVGLSSARFAPMASTTGEALSPRTLGDVSSVSVSASDMRAQNTENHPYVSQPVANNILRSSPEAHVLLDLLMQRSNVFVRYLALSMYHGRRQRMINCLPDVGPCWQLDQLRTMSLSIDQQITELTSVVPLTMFQSVTMSSITGGVDSVTMALKDEALLKRKMEVSQPDPKMVTRACRLAVTQWSWMTDDGGWVPYPHSDKIQSQYQKWKQLERQHFGSGKQYNCFTFQHGLHTYEIDFCAMRQRNLSLPSSSEAQVSQKATTTTTTSSTITTKLLAARNALRVVCDRCMVDTLCVVVSAVCQLVLITPGLLDQRQPQGLTGSAVTDVSSCVQSLCTLKSSLMGKSVLSRQAVDHVLHVLTAVESKAYSYVICAIDHAATHNYILHGLVPPVLAQTLFHMLAAMRFLMAVQPGGVAVLSPTTCSSTTMCSSSNSVSSSTNIMCSSTACSSPTLCSATPPLIRAVLDLNRCQNRLVRRTFKMANIAARAWPVSWVYAPLSTFVNVVPVSSIIDSSSLVNMSNLSSSGALADATKTSSDKELITHTTTEVNDKCSSPSDVMSFQTRLQTRRPTWIPFQLLKSNTVQSVILDPSFIAYKRYHDCFMQSVCMPIAALSNRTTTSSAAVSPSHITKGYHGRITRIFQVQNPKLWQRFQNRKEELQLEYDPTGEMSVELADFQFHGTGASSLADILAYGLNPVHHSGSIVGRRHGNGAYTTPIASFATYYAMKRRDAMLQSIIVAPPSLLARAHTMPSPDIAMNVSPHDMPVSNEVYVLVCRVLRGHCEIGTDGQVAPNPVPNTHNMVRYTTMVDAITTPLQYCSPQPDLIYVEAVICFEGHECP